MNLGHNPSYNDSMSVSSPNMPPTEAESLFTSAFLASFSKAIMNPLVSDSVAHSSIPNPAYSASAPPFPANAPIVQQQYGVPTGAQGGRSHPQLTQLPTQYQHHPQQFGARQATSYPMMSAHPHPSHHPVNYGNHGPSPYHGHAGGHAGVHASYQGYPSHQQPVATSMTSHYVDPRLDPRRPPPYHQQHQQQRFVQTSRLKFTVA